MISTDPPVNSCVRPTRPPPHTGPNRWRRYERARPGELVHIDATKLGHIRAGGAWPVHGRDCAQTTAARSGPRVGYDYIDVAVDDHSRLAYVEVINTAQGGENQYARTGFGCRADSWFTDHGVEIERIMTDNAMSYRRSRLFADTCTEWGITRRFTKPRCPRPTERPIGCTAP